MLAMLGPWVYFGLFFIVFAETGLAVGFFLPGDSLLVVCGLFAAAGKLNIWLMWVLLFVAAVVGDAVGYYSGRKVGPAVFSRPKSRFFNPKHLQKAHAFYEKHGGKTIIIARFLPIIRTFAPFVAGIGQMSYPRFAFYNVAGGIGWILSLTLAGYLFGNIPLVRKNFSLVILAIIVISILPALVEVLRQRRRARTTAG